MPDLPQITENVDPNVAQGGIGVQVTPDETGAAVGGALENTAEIATRIHATAVTNFNQSMVLDAHNQLQQFNQDTLFDPQKGLLNKNLGKDAPVAAQGALTAYDAKVGSISDGLANDQQREQFLRLAQDNRFTIQSHLDGYESRQMSSYQEGVTNATVKNSATAAVQNVGGVLANPDPRLQDPGARATAINSAATNSIDLGAAAITDNFRRQNPTAPANDPRLTEQLNAYQSAAHYGVLQSLMSQGKDQDAQAYYATNKGAFVGTEADTAARMVDEGTTAGTAVRQAPTYAMDPKDGQIVPRGTAYDALNADLASGKLSPKQYDATLTQVNRLFEQHDEAKRQMQSGLLDNLWNVARSSPLGVNAPEVQAQMQKLSPEQQTYLIAGTARAEKQAVPSNSPLAIKVMDMSYDTKPQADGLSGADRFKTMDPNQWRGQVSDADLDKIVHRREVLQGQAEKTEQDTTDEATSRVISESLGQAWHISDRRDPATGLISDDAASFHRAIYADIEANGGTKKLGTQGVQKLCDDLLMKQSMAVPGRWFGTNQVTVPKFKTLPPGYAFNASQLDGDTRSRIVSALTKAGAARPTDAEIYQYYQNQAAHANP